jgi:hypothetical protein
VSESEHHASLSSISRVSHAHEESGGGLFLTSLTLLLLIATIGSSLSSSFLQQSLEGRERHEQAPTDSDGRDLFQMGRFVCSVAPDT